MKKIIVFSVLCLAIRCSAQSENYTIYTVVGDTSDFTLSSGMSYTCQERFNFERSSSSDPYIIGPHLQSIRFIPNKNGVWYDTCVFHWIATADSQNEGCREISSYAYITAYGVEDSTVKLRPDYYIFVPMREKKPLGQWDGYFTIRLDNNIASQTTFKNFKLRYNFPPGLQVEVLDGNQVITSYSAKPFERQKSLTAHLSLTGAPLADSVSFQGDFVLDAVSNDTTRQLSSSLYVTIYPFAGSSVTPVNFEPLSLQVFPNPLKGRTQISFILPEQSECRLQIINILGEEIRTIYKGLKSRGVQNIFFDPTDIPAGEYFCELQAGSTVTREKIIIEK